MVCKLMFKGKCQHLEEDIKIQEHKCLPEKNVQLRSKTVYSANIIVKKVVAHTKKINQKPKWE